MLTLLGFYYYSSTASSARYMLNDFISSPPTITERVAAKTWSLYQDKIESQKAVSKSRSFRKLAEIMGCASTERRWSVGW